MPKSSMEAAEKKREEPLVYDASGEKEKRGKDASALFAGGGKKLTVLYSQRVKGEMSARVRRRKKEKRVLVGGHTIARRHTSFQRVKRKKERRRSRLWNASVASIRERKR